MPWILGYGSLLHPDSLRQTVPQIKLKDIYPVVVPKTKRLFNLVPPGWADMHLGVQGMKVAALNADPNSVEKMNAVAFWLSECDLPPLDRREFCYRRIENVAFEHWDASVCGQNRGDWVQEVSAQTDQEPSEKFEKGVFYSVMDKETLKASYPQRYRDEFEPLGVDGLKSADVLPHEAYLGVCLQGARYWGDDFLLFFLRHTYLGDGVRRLDEYLGAADIQRHLAVDLKSVLQRRR